MTVVTPGNPILGTVPPHTVARTTSNASYNLLLFRSTCTANILLTLLPLLLYIPTLCACYSDLKLFLSPLIVIVFFCVVMLLQVRRANGHFTILEALLTNALLAGFVCTGVAFVGISITLVLYYNGNDLANKRNYANLLIVYSSSIPSVSVFLLLQLAANSPHQDPAWFPFGRTESRVAFFRWHRAYCLWTVISIIGVFFFVLDYNFKSDNNEDVQVKKQERVGAMGWALAGGAGKRSLVVL